MLVLGERDVCQCGLWPALELAVSCRVVSIGRGEGWSIAVGLETGAGDADVWIFSAAAGGDLWDARVVRGGAGGWRGVAAGDVCLVVDSGIVAAVLCVADVETWGAAVGWRAECD